MSNLLEKASIILTPTGYDNGSMNCIKPIQTFGSELVTNGDFATDSNWVKGTGWTISGGTANQDGSNGILRQTNVVSTNTKVKVTFDLTNYGGSGNLQVKFAPSIHTITLTGDGSYTVFTDGTNSVNGDLQIITSSGFVGSIDNVSVKEVIDADFDFTRGSAATRVNSQGLVKNVQILGSNLIPDGNFTNQAAVDYWDIASSRATKSLQDGFMRLTYDVAVGGALLKQGNVIPSGKSYNVTFRAKGTANSAFNSIGDNANISGNPQYVVLNPTLSSDFQNYEFNVPLTGSNFRLYLASAQIGDTLDITNISVVEITNDTNLPRIDYSPYIGAGTCGHWLLEPQSTYLEVNSADLSTGWGATTGASQQVETGITPFGVSGNIKRVSGATNSPPSWVDNANSLKKQYTVTATDPASTFTFSVYVKSAGSTAVNIQLRNNTAGPSATTGAITLNSDWQRVSVTLAVTTTTTAIGVVIAGTDGDILLSGAQLEAKEFASSLIPTDGAIGIRNQDKANNSGSSDLISLTEGVLYCEIAALFSGDGENRCITLSDGTGNLNTVEIFYQESANTIKYRIKDGNGVNINNTETVADRTQFNKIALKYKSGDNSMWLNGVKVDTDTSTFSFTTTLSELNFSQANGSQKFFGKVKSVVVFKEALTDAELTCLTT